MPRAGSAHMFHPKFAESLRKVNRFPLFVTIQSRTETRSETGSVSYVWAPVVGYENIPCVKIDKLSGENRLPDLIEAKDLFVIILNKYAPNIVPAWRAILDGNLIYDIEGVQSDSAKLFTQLDVRRISPNVAEGV